MTSAKWAKGYTQAELDRAQQRFDLVFPPDLVALPRERRPVEGYVWTDEVAIKRALEWPVEGLLSSIGTGFIWRPEWGEKPASRMPVRRWRGPSSCTLRN